MKTTKKQTKVNELIQEVKTLLTEKEIEVLFNTFSKNKDGITIEE